MQKNLYQTVLLLLIVLTGCQKDKPSSPDNSGAALLAKTSGTMSGSGTVYLSVTIDTLIDNGTPVNRIQSDGRGAYIHGKDRVEAQILSSDGNFYMNTNNNTVKLPVRTMHFPLDNQPTSLPLEGKRNYSLRTTITGTWLQNMATGVENAQLVGFRIWGVQQNGVVDWKLLFRNGIENTASSLTDYVKVTRLSDGEWTLEPAQLSTPPAFARLIDGNNPPNPIGSEYYTVPFRLTLQKVN